MPLRRGTCELTRAKTQTHLTAAPLPIQPAEPALVVRGAGLVAGSVRDMGDLGFRASRGAGNLPMSDQIVRGSGHCACLFILPAIDLVGLALAYLLPIISHARETGDWMPNLRIVAALAVWLLSVGTLLIGACGAGKGCRFRPQRSRSMKQPPPPCLPRRQRDN